MSQPFIGEVRLFSFDFAPTGWALCNGVSLPISQYNTLFELIKTTYGGDGITTFNLPNLLGRIPIHFSTDYPIGALGGTETVTLTDQQTPTHTHSRAASSSVGDKTSPANALLATTGIDVYSTSPATPPTPPTIVAMAAQTDSGLCVGASHSNLMPSLCINYAIALTGIFPSQN